MEALEAETFLYWRRSEGAGGGGGRGIEGRHGGGDEGRAEGMANAWKEINTEPSASQEKDSIGGWIANQIPIQEVWRGYWI